MRDSTTYSILSLRQRAQVQDRWLRQRLDEMLPEIMERESFDMWIVAAREYNEDPVIMTLLPSEMLSARRLTILVFYLSDGGELERMILSRYDLGDLYRGVWDPEREEQWACLARLIQEREPRRIGVGVSETFAFGDGLTHSEHCQLVGALDPVHVDRIEGAERLAVGWLERRLPAEMEAYSRIVEIAHCIIEEAFSSRVIHPGITTTQDVQWWFRQRILDLGLSAWFHPSVSIQANGLKFREKDARTLIRPGDLLHCDVGLHYLGLATDTQQMAYVLDLGETDAPKGLKAGLAQGNCLQEILAEECVAARSGNEILERSLKRASKQGLRASIYTHPIGYHGHGAGPTIGLWDRQGGVPGKGDYELFDDTCHAMELNVTCEVPEWDGQDVVFALEQDVLFSRGKIYYLAGRQTNLHLIG